MGLPLSTNSLQQKYAIHLSPNPTTDILNIRLDIPSLTDDLEFRLFNLAGKNVLTGKIEDNNHQLNLSAFPKGAYMLKIYSHDFSLFEKVILQ